MTEQYFAEIEDQEYQIEIVSDKKVIVNGQPYNVDFQNLRQELSYSLLVEGHSYEINLYQENGFWEVLLRGKQISVKVEDDRERRLRMAAGESTAIKPEVSVLAPMPGLVIDIPVEEGRLVDEGDVLIILESMKMQNELRAPRPGKIAKIHIQLNENVERKQTLMILE